MIISTIMRIFDDVMNVGFWLFCSYKFFKTPNADPTWVLWLAAAFTFLSWVK